MLATRPGRSSLQVVARESRIGAKPIVLPKGVSASIDGVTLKVKVGVAIERRRKDEARMARSRQTLSLVLIIII